MTVRPEVVGLLMSLDYNDPDPITEALRGLPAVVRKQDGTALDDDEITVLRSATPAEYKATVDYGATVAEYHQQKTADLQRIVELTKPYYAGLPDDATMTDVMPLLPVADRAEVGLILARVAPDGQVFIEGTGP